MAFVSTRHYYYEVKFLLLLLSFNVNVITCQKTSEQILNDIVNYGLDQSRYLYEVQERNIYNEGVALKKSNPAHFVGVFNKQKPRAKELSKYGYATLQASSLLTRE